MATLRQEFRAVLASLAALGIVAFLGACSSIIRINLPATSTTPTGPTATVITTPALNQTALPSPSAEKELRVTVGATQPVISSPEPTLTQPVTSVTHITPSASNISACPSVNSDAALPAKPATITDTAQALTTYLNNGASDSALLSALKSWGDVYTATNSRDQLGTVLRAKLLPGTDEQVIVIYYNPLDRQAVTRHGDLIVFQCVTGKMQVAYQASSDPEFGVDVTNLRVFSTTDVTGDGLDDLSFLMGDCSGNTCFDGINIMTADRSTLASSATFSITADSDISSELENAIPDFIYEPYPAFHFVPALHGKAKDLVVKPGYVSSVDAGPQRDVTDTWSFVGGIFTLTQEVKEPPVYRIHALEDGDAAFRRKDYAAANVLYMRVVNDPSLQAWDGNPNLHDEQQLLTAFAYVRMMQTAAVVGNMTGVQSAYKELVHSAPSNSPGAMYAQLGETFYKVWSQAKNYPQACAATVTYAQTHDNTYVMLGQETYGFSNDDYEPEDMCIVP